VSAPKSARLSRRNFLRGLGGTAIALPLLNFVDAGRSHAGPPSFPKRIVFWYTPDGTIQNAWWPTGTASAFTLNRIMKPLEPFKRQLVILENLDMGVTYSGPGDMHQVGMGGLLTGRELQDGSLFVGAGGQATGWANGASVDQYIASRLGQTTPFPSLELGVQVIGSTVWTRMCYRAAAQPVPPESEPSRAFNRLFTSLGAPSDPASQALRTQRRSVLDGVSRDFAKLNARVSAADRVKLGAHLDVVRDIERRLDLGGGVLPAACALPAAPPATLDTDQVGNFPAIGKLQMDLLVAALACDLTRVGSIQWSNAVSATVHTWLGATQGHHELSHSGDADTAAQETLTKMNEWFAQQLAYFAGRLQSIPEGSGTMLDNTVIVCVNELSIGNAHSRYDMPFLLLGGCGGAIPGGRWLRFPTGTNHNDLLVSLCHAMGLTDVTTFGNPKYCSGPLPGLLATV
jgi:hypothetical protein